PLIKVAIPDPSRTNSEVSDSRPALPCWSIRPGCKVDLLVPLQLRTLRQKRLPLKLQRLFTLPANHNARSAIRRKIPELSTCLKSIENNLKLLGYADAHQRRLRNALRRNTPQHCQFAAGHKLKQLCPRHAQEDTPNLHHPKIPPP